MINIPMMQMLQDAYKNPVRKFCYYTAGNNHEIGRALGLEMWDWTPQQTVNVEPWFWNTHTVPLAMGCEPVFTSEGKEWIRPFIHEPEQAGDIVVPDVRAGRTGEILEKMAEMLRKYPEDVLIRLPDIQSPLGAAELMWDQSFYTALLTHPDVVHTLLNKITLFTIHYVKAIRQVLGNRLNAACHPQVWADSEGFYISDDANSMVSPPMHAEFGTHYINRIIDACGPVYYHSCTWTEPYFQNIRSVKNMKGANWSTGTSQDPALLIREFSGHSLLLPHIGADQQKEKGICSLNKAIRDEADVVRYFLDSMQDNTTLYFWFHDGLVSKVETMVRIYRLFEEYGYTPRQHGVA